MFYVRKYSGYHDLCYISYLVFTKKRSMFYFLQEIGRLLPAKSLTLVLIGPHVPLDLHERNGSFENVKFSMLRGRYEDFKLATPDVAFGEIFFIIAVPS